MSLKAAQVSLFALAVLLLSVADLLVLLLWPTRAPDAARGQIVGACLVASALLLASLPFVLRFVERQTWQIERQQKEIETVHALDTAIVRELDLPRLLDTAVRRLMRVLDVEAAGIVLPAPDGEQVAFLIPDRSAREAAAFQQIMREGGGASAVCETLVLPLSDGGPQGFVGVGRFRPARPFTPSEQGLLATLADTLAVALTNARAFAAERETVRVQADLERERRVARAMTESLLPIIPPRLGCWAFSTCYRAKSPDAPVGGDLYDWFTLESGRVGIVLADVSGKGLGAAKKLALIKYALRAYAREHLEPSAVVRRLNDTLFDEPDMTGFVTLFYGVLDIEARRFTYTSAGHEPPLLRRADGRIELLEPDGMVLGVARVQEYDDCTLELHPGDGLLLYTDGLSESRPDKNTAFLEISGIASILTDLMRADRPAPRDMTDAILARALRQSRDQLSDDVALLWFECLPD